MRIKPANFILLPFYGLDVSFAWGFLGDGEIKWVKFSERGWNRTRAKGALAVQET
jgi:hypothetical protein